MRHFLIMTTMLLIISAAPNARADDASKLFQALASQQLAQIPQGFSSASVGSIPLNKGSQRAGIIGIAKITLTGKDTSGEVRYALFSNKQDFEEYVREFAMPGDSIFFPYFPKANCTANGNRQACEFEDGTVMIIALTRNLTEGVHATTAGNLAQSALKHLRAVRKSIGQPAPPAQD